MDTGILEFIGMETRDGHMYCGFYCVGDSRWAQACGAYGDAGTRWAK